MAFNPMMAAGATGVGGMVKALMDGNSEYSDQQKKQQMLQQMIAAKAQQGVVPGMGQPRVADINSGAVPMPSQPPTAGMGQVPISNIGSMTPPVNPRAMPGGLNTQGLGMQPFPQAGASPVGVDPMTQALFSPIPGVGGQ